MKARPLLFVVSTIACLFASADSAGAAVATMCVWEGQRCNPAETVPCCNPQTLCTFQFYDPYTAEPIWNCQAVD